MVKGRWTKLWAGFALLAVFIGAFPLLTLAEEDTKSQTVSITGLYDDIQPVELDIDYIAPGGSHSLALDTDGNVWAWGYNTRGEQGDGTIGDIYKPIHKVELPQKAIAIDAGGQLSFAVLADGSLYRWGRNSYNYMDAGVDQVNYTLPYKVEGIPAVKSVHVHYYNVMILCEDGTVWGMGKNESGELALGHNGPVDVLTQTPIDNVQTLHFSGDNGYAIKNTGDIIVWGSNDGGQTGVGYESIYPYWWIGPTVPRTLTDVTMKLSNYKQSFYLTSGGEFLFAGVSPPGKAGVYSKPTRLFDTADVVDIGVSNSTTCVLREDGSVWIAGSNRFGLLGEGSSDTSKIYRNHVYSETITNTNPVEFASKCWNNIFVKSANGDWWVWGANSDNIALPNHDAFNHEMLLEPVRIFSATGQIPNPDGHTITVTETYADDSQPDEVNTYTVEDGNAWSGLFTTPEGYTAEVESTPTVSVNYDAGRLHIASVAEDYDIKITYTPDEGEPDPDPDVYTITVTETWADGAEADRVTTYEVEPGRAWSITYSLPEGYTASVACDENLSINYEAQRLYLYQVLNDFDVVITYTAE